MDLSKFRKLNEEFPFIEETVIKNDAGGNRFNPKYLDSIRIELVTPLLMGIMPQKYIWLNNREAFENILKWQQIHFVLNNGKIIRNAVRQHVFSSNFDNMGETVLETIVSHKLEWDLRYIVFTQGGYNILNNRSMPNFKATIYKLKRGTTYHQIIEEAEESVREWEKYYYHTPYGFSC